MTRKAKNARNNMTAAAQNILAEITALGPDQLRQVRAAVGRLLGDDAPVSAAAPDNTDEQFVYGIMAEEMQRRGIRAEPFAVFAKASRMYPAYRRAIPELMAFIRKTLKAQTRAYQKRAIAMAIRFAFDRLRKSKRPIRPATIAPLLAYAPELFDDAFPGYGPLLPCILRGRIAT